MKCVGFIGWRGMVGSVLIERMIKKKNFDNIIPYFFSTSQIGKSGPILSKNQDINILYNAYDTDILQEMDILVTCYGNDYTKIIYKKLKKKKWKGYWIDASSYLRMKKKSIICLDPINKELIYKGLEKGIKNFIGGNCTVSLMLMALSGLFKKDLIDWISVSTYQAASGGGSKNMCELLEQMGFIYKSIKYDLKNINYKILEIEKKIKNISLSNIIPKENFKCVLFGSLIPWIDKRMNNGQSREEWKGQAETNKILSSKKKIIVDGLCVRIGTFRCHSQSLTIKIKKNISIQEIKQIISNDNRWVKIVPNVYEETIKKLTPINVSGTLNILIGRLRKMNIGSKYISAFTIGDQLLWGAAEPIRRILEIIILNT
ncbi:Aspartate-semialdehyde dehydrogenase [Candidatus Annandia adelgestsuga]|uniref:Aspartate-semialdehyde dehydrogenase n=1 Tax=Candidatus Annandia adelgestsuga TaxID=1302411 RepID=A0A3S9J7C9_9ENTR|nr:aspartate-semialdehyde dehydrogenase [Candidatus Annandia adelgestsuga]AZP36281.1 Aspartate-semialdehyde dehydrogenase [Candidatus Annandia adelgestsuga]